MNDLYIEATLRLIRSENLGPLSFHKLLRKYKNPAEIIKDWDNARNIINRKVHLASIQQVATEMEKTRHFGAQFLTIFDTAYPPLLKQLPDAPPILTIKGHKHLLQKKILGIVGARNASIHGCRLAHKIAQSLGEVGWTIVSGLARGIDTAAHKASLDTSTIAALAGGINIIYPEENKKLYEEIALKGLLITEAPFDSMPQSSHFPKRNRLISGLSQGLLVVEAAVQSGSLITAHYATDQGREVFAVPGSPLDPRCRGSNFLLKQGAILTETAEDILNVLEGRLEFLPTQANQSTFDFAGDITISDNTENLEARILRNLGAPPLSIDTLLKETDIPVNELWSCLLKLELKGKVERHDGDSFSKTMAQP